MPTDPDVHQLGCLEAAMDHQETEAATRSSRRASSDAADRPDAVRSDLRGRRPTFWTNRGRLDSFGAAGLTRHLTGIGEARSRFERLAPLLALVLPALGPSGAVRSRLLETPTLARSLGLERRGARLLVKADAELPVAGSIKARGGFHAVLEIAEQVARRTGLLGGGEPATLAGSAARECFARHEIVVGSTGNLGLSIGMLATALGFRATVHMSSDAKQWKKDRLRAEGARVLEHRGDYADALAAGRVAAEADPQAVFIDDEDSTSLLYGYATAAAELVGQLDALGIPIDAENPLVVHLPCGVGGAPAGIALGLHAILGDACHCVFAEPVDAPCVLAAMVAERDDLPSVHDLDLSGRTTADGLAVPRASRVAVDIARPILSAAYTVTDDELLRLLFLAHRDEGLRLEPSAAAGLAGPGLMQAGGAGAAHPVATAPGRVTHVAWATGGLLTPEDEFEALRSRGETLAAGRRTSGATA